MEIKTYECSICERLTKKGLKGEKRFTGTRKNVRKHLREIHHIKGIKNYRGEHHGERKGQFRSNISKETLAYEINKGVRLDG